MWFHIDGAYGAPAAAAASTAALFLGLERADSVAIDPHKWLYLPKAVGCVLLRDGGVLADAFADDAEYLENVGDGPYAGPDWPVFQGIEVTHPFRGLGSDGPSPTEPTRSSYAVGDDAAGAAAAEAVREAPTQVARRPAALDRRHRHHPPGLDDPARLDAHNRALTRCSARARAHVRTTIRGFSPCGPA